MALSDWLEEELAELRERCLLRVPDQEERGAAEPGAAGGPARADTATAEAATAEAATAEAATAEAATAEACGSGSPEELWLDASSNDYLGFGRRPVSRETLDGLTGVSAGAGASRLIFGTAPQHREAEGAIADWMKAEAALLFSSGYAANVGVLQALGHEGDLIVSDALNHASIIDGCRLSRATVKVTPHLDIDAMGRELREGTYRRRFVVTESYFSMDGDSPHLPRLRQLCDENDAALIVDEAHALGIYGPAGRGLCAATGVVPDVLVGTLGKALGLHGAFITGSTELRTWLWNRARSFVFSTAVSPLIAALVPPRIQATAAADAARERLDELAKRLRAAISRSSLATPARSHGPIIVVILGTPERALAARDALAQERVRVQAIRPPTVPPGTSRLRLTLNASLTDAHFGRLEAAITRALSPIGQPPS